MNSRKKFFLIVISCAVLSLFYLIAHAQSLSDIETQLRQMGIDMQGVPDLNQLMNKYKEVIEILDRTNRETGHITGYKNISSSPEKTPEKEIARRRALINIQYANMKNMASKLESPDSPDENPQLPQAIPVDGYIIINGGEREMWYHNEVKKELFYKIRESFVGNLIVLHTYNREKGFFEKEKDYMLDTLSTDIKLQSLSGRTCSRWSPGSPSVCMGWASFLLYEIEKGEFYPNFYSGVVSLDSSSDGKISIEANAPKVIFYAIDGLKKIPAHLGCSQGTWSIKKSEFETLLKKGYISLTKEIGSRSQASPGCMPGSTITLYLKISKDETEICRNKENISIEIVSPKHQSRHVFTDKKEGTLTIEFEAKVTPEKYANAVEWDIPQLDGSIRKVYPASLTPNPKGSKILVTYKGLPTYNDAFGKKTIKARLKVEGCTIEDAKEIAIFYPRDEKNNPQGKYPNWFYYWRQTPAGMPFGHNVRINFDCEGVPLNKCVCIDKNGNRTNVAGMYNYDLSDYKTVNVCDLRKNADNPETFEINIPAIKLSIPQTLAERKIFKYTYIDTFAVVIMHEFTHFLNNHNFWPYGYDPLFDRDRDTLPDRIESDLGLDPKKKLTYWEDKLRNPQNPDEYWADDEELLTLSATYDYPIGTFDQYDWAKPGKNWQD